MSLLAPAFLLGLGALAIPVLVHLIHRERSETVAFPSLMFLRRIPYRSVRRQKIRHWLLFVLRCAAIVLVVAAFARPFLDDPTQATAPFSNAGEVVVLLDHSYSMGYGDRWERGVRAAQSAIGELRPDDRASFVLFSDRATAVVRSTTDRAGLTVALDTAELSSAGTRYGPALKLAEKILEVSQLPNKRIVLISDYQRTGWTGDEGVRLPAGTAVSRVNLSDRNTTNHAITGLSLSRGRRAGRELVTVSARVAQRGGDAAGDVDVSLELDGRQVQTSTVSVESNGTATVSFDPFAIPDGPLRGTVRAANDRLLADNAWHFVLTPSEAVSVLVLEDQAAPAERSLFLRRALGVGDRPSFRVTVKKTSQFQSADLAEVDVVVLNDAAVSGPARRRAVRSFVAGGGGLLVALGDRSSPQAWRAETRELLPGPFDRPSDRSADWGGALGFVDYQHPVFEMFSTPRSGDFSSARFFQYRPVLLESSDDVLARFDDGAVALVENRIGDGTVLVWTSTLDPFWNDLALKPVFVPFAHRVVTYLAHYVEPPVSYAVGQAADLAGMAVDDRELLVTAPRGTRFPLEAADGVRPLQLWEQGFYEVRDPDITDAPLYPVAVNLDVSESDLTALDPDELEGAITAGAPAAAGLALDANLTPEQRERRQAIWWYLLIAALFVLAGETVLSNRLSRAVR